jgi:hypothetical protein
MISLRCGLVRKGRVHRSTRVEWAQSTVIVEVSSRHALALVLWRSRQATSSRLILQVERHAPARCAVRGGEMAERSTRAFAAVSGRKWRPV